MTSLTSELCRLFDDCLSDANPLDAFNDLILNRVDRSRVLHDGSHPGEYWWAQRQIAEALWDPTVDTVAVPAGHSVGKSYFAAGALLGWTGLQPNALVVSTSPSNVQLDGVLWGEVRKARSRSAIFRDVGRYTKVPNKLDLGEGWLAIGYSTNKAERLQGWHSSGPLLVLVDEASGIDSPDIWATLESLKPTKKLLLGNTLWDKGMFYETCKRADDGDKTVRKIWIPSTHSPDIKLPRSERGLADAKFLENMARQYGIGSTTWRVRVGAEFPEGSADRLIPVEWLDAAERAEHAPRGVRRMGIDLGLGNGGDDTCFVVRDDNGVIHWEASDRINFAAAAAKAAGLAERFGVQPSRISWDAGGLGSTFHANLKAVGLVGCLPYRGGAKSLSLEFNNLRTACHVMLRRRLDPDHRDNLAVYKPPFHIPRLFMDRLRKELWEITHTPGPKSQTILRGSDEVREALGFSPDFCDTLCQTFAFPNT